MNTIRKAALALLALIVAFSSGCGRRHTPKEVYYLVASNLSLPYWQTLSAGFNKAAALYGVTARIAGPATHDPQAELAALQQAVAARPAGILVSAADAAVLQNEINTAIVSGIPVLTVDSDAPGSRRLYFIGTNNLEAGRLGGQRVVEKLGGHGTVVFFTIAGQANMNERLKGFQDVLATRPEIKIVNVFDTRGDARNAFDEAQRLAALSGTQKIDAFVALDSASGKQIAEVMRRNKLTDRLVVAWDVDQDTLNDIKAGSIDSTIAQKPFTMGFVGLRALDNVFHYPPKELARDYAADSFAPYPVFVDTGTSLVDRNNVEIYLASAAAGMK